MARVVCWFQIGPDPVDVRSCFERFRVQNWEASMASCCTGGVCDTQQVTDPFRAPVGLQISNGSSFALL